MMLYKTTAMKKSYSDQIKSPKWQKKRLEILQLHDYTCEECGNKEKQLHVHHRFYIKGREIHEYDNDVLQCLCEDCHSKKHEKKEPENILSLDELNILSCIKKIQSIDKDIYNNISFILNESINGNTQSIYLLLANAYNSYYFNYIYEILKVFYEKELYEIQNYKLKIDIEKLSKKQNNNEDRLLSFSIKNVLHGKA